MLFLFQMLNEVLHRIASFVLLHENETLLRIVGSANGISEVKHLLIILQPKHKVANHFEIVSRKCAHHIETIQTLELIV